MEQDPGERLTRLEARQHYEMVLMQRSLAYLERRLDLLEHTSPPSGLEPLTGGVVAKLLLALLLPFLVLLVTGDPQAALGLLKAGN